MDANGGTGAPDAVKGEFWLVDLEHLCKDRQWLVATEVSALWGIFLGGGRQGCSFFLALQVQSWWM